MSSEAISPTLTVHFIFELRGGSTALICTSDLKVNWYALESLLSWLAAEWQLIGTTSVRLWIRHGTDSHILN